MKTYLLHHLPKSSNQDTWAVAFSIPYIACAYVRAGDGLWYVKTWLTDDQIRRRLAILLDSQDELHIHELSRKDATLGASKPWLPGRLEDEDAVEFPNPPRFMRDVLQSAVSFVSSATRIPPAAIVAASSRNSRAA